MGTHNRTLPGRPEPSVFRRMSRYFIPVLFFFAIIGIFLLNNYDILTEHRRDPEASISYDTTREASRSYDRGERTPATDSDTVESLNQLAPKVRNGSPRAVHKAFSDSDTSFVVDIPPIIFVAPGRDGVAIRVSLRILLESTETRREVLLKREEIKVVAHRLFGSPESADLSVVEQRSRLLGEINRLIESGHIDRIEFTEYRPVVRE